MSTTSPAATSATLLGRLEATSEVVRGTQAHVRIGAKLFPRVLGGGLLQLVDLLAEVHFVALAGNGGSASVASHLATDFWTQAGVQATSPADVGFVTAAANDLGYEATFVRWLQSLQRPPGPWAFVAMSCSGKSPNVLAAVRCARALNATVVGLMGLGNEPDAPPPLLDLCDLAFVAPSRETGPTQIAHHTILHVACDELATRRKK